LPTGHGRIAVNIVGLVAGISGMLEQVRRTAGRSVNSILTATYRDPGRFTTEAQRSRRGDKFKELAPDFGVTSVNDDTAELPGCTEAPR